MIYGNRSRHRYKLPQGFKAQFDDSLPKPKRKYEPRRKKRKNGGSNSVWRYQRTREAMTEAPIKRYNLADSRLDYEEYLNGPYWKRLRKEILKRHKVCQDCGTDKRLNLHHRHYYVGGKSVLYRERSYPGLLVVLCYSCHMKRHRTAEV